jgi:hypothetical protein
MSEDDAAADSPIQRLLAAGRVGSAVIGVAGVVEAIGSVIGWPSPVVIPVSGAG